MALNFATSIVDYLKGQGKSSDFTSRQNLYSSSGLSTAFGDYRGTPEQNTSLLKKLSTATPAAAPAPAVAPTPAQDTTSAAFLLGKTTPGMHAYVPPTPAPTAKDVIDQTGPSTISSAFDLEQSDADKQAEAEKKELTMDLAATSTRGAEGLQRDVATLQRTAQEGISELGLAGTKKQTEIGEEAAGFGGAFSGVTKKSQAEVAQEVVTKQTSIKAKLGDSLYNSFSDFEKNYGTKFLESLSIPEAEQFTKLPAPVRGIVMQQYQEAVAKAEEKAQKNVVSALDKLGYVVVGGQIIRKPSEARAEEAGVRAEERLTLAEAAGARAEAAAAKSGERLTASEEKQAAIPVIESSLLRSKGTDGFVDPKSYLSERMKSPFSGSDFDARFSHLLSPEERAALKDKDPLGFDNI